MFAKQIDVQESQATVEELLALVQEGGEIILMRGDTPVARILPVEANPQKERILGMHPGSIWMSDDFNDPLPDEFWFGEDE
ncbi:MAG: toxin-antitoxin (TA) system antitoxin [Leptolyngbya sp.]|nr:toxin-antitoxin (TA) system antitoxin [Candidatus Melainabacteria bacterium]